MQPFRVVGTPFLYSHVGYSALVPTAGAGSTEMGRARKFFPDFPPAAPPLPSRAVWCPTPRPSTLPLRWQLHLTILFHSLHWKGFTAHRSWLNLNFGASDEAFIFCAGRTACFASLWGDFAWR